jgi:hypothetical protein
VEETVGVEEDWAGRRTCGVERRPVEYGEGLRRAVGRPEMGDDDTHVDLRDGEGRERWSWSPPYSMGERDGVERACIFFPKSQ